MKKECNKKKPIKKIIFSMLAVVFIILLLIAIPFRNNFFDFFDPSTPKYQPLTIKKEHWMNIFIHGTFSSLLGFLSISNVIKDDVKGSDYRKLTKKMRRDSFFYQTQPILQKGLIKIEPTFSLKTINENRCAAYPLIKSYQLLAESLEPEDQVNHFYTFGWSGLLSQSRRRKEAIRLFNAIKEEIEKYHRQDIYPKIRLISHSHGGNLILNLAAINKILNLKSLLKKAPDKLSDNTNENESLLEMSKMMQNLSKASPKIKKAKSQKRWDYIPKDCLNVDEFISYGAPIQPETESFCFDDTFKKIYLFYSGEDVVQGFDWVSTKRYYSDQRLTTTSKNQNKVIQAKIMVGRKIFEKNLQTEDSQPPENDDEDKNSSLFQRLFSTNKLFPKSNDPTHREFWFINWKQNNPKKTSIFGILPSVIFTPLFTKALEKLELNDVDINIDSLENQVLITVFKHNERVVQSQQNLSSKLIEEIKAKFIPWQPKIEEKDKEFSIIRSYSN